MKSIVSRNPYSGEIKEQITYFTAEMLQRCFEKTAAATSLQARRTPKDKVDIIRELPLQIERKRAEIARLITCQTGRPITEAENEVRQALQICKYYGQHSQGIMSLNVKSTARKKTLVKYLPTGTVFCIFPFAHPFALNLYHTLPQLLLGNCVLAKHASSTPGVGRLIERLMISSGFESGEYQNCFVQHERSEQILSRSEISGVSFTGSTENGRKIAEIAGRYLKMSSLQLGTSDSMIVAEDADVGLALESLMKKGHFNSGQGGSGPKRIIIHEKHYDGFKSAMVEKANRLIYGNPLEKQTEIGPLARPELLSKLEQKLGQLPVGMKVVYRRENIQSPFFPITIVQSEIQAAIEELIGPVFILYRAKEEAQLIRIANNSRYGNASYVFSSRADDLAERLKGGSVYMNQLNSTSSPAPRGGVGLSGYGRGGGSEGIRQFANIKTVYIN